MFGRALRVVTVVRGGFSSLRLFRTDCSVVKGRGSLWRGALLTGAMFSRRGDNGGSAQSRRLTREATALKERERFLSMDVKEKRKLYKCGDRFKGLEDVPTWPQVYHEERSRNKLKIAKQKPLFEVNEKLNNKVAIWKGDITTLEIDAITNAANGSLMGGGGVDGAIHSAAGSMLRAECETLNGCDTGDAKITAGYKLPAKYIIHTVGPIGQNESKLQSCYTTSLALVLEHDLRAVAFPCISTGIYGYPNRPAAEIAISTVREWLESDGVADKVDLVIFCLFLPVDVDVYRELMQVYFPVGDDSAAQKQDSPKKTPKKDSPKKTSKKGSSPTKDKKQVDAKSERKEQENGKTEAVQEGDGDNKTKNDSKETAEDSSMEVAGEGGGADGGSETEAQTGAREAQDGGTSPSAQSPSRSPQTKKKPPPPATGTPSKSAEKQASL